MKKGQFVLEYNTYCGILRTNLPKATTMDEAREEAEDLICKLSGDRLFPYRLYKLCDDTHWNEPSRKNPNGARYIENEEELRD
jgi:hypothetical protein